MRFSTFLFSVLLLLSLPGFSQGLLQTVRGRLTDEVSSQPIVGATVAILDLQPVKGAYTDEQGYFVIRQVPIGRHTIRASSLNYEEVILSEVLVNSAREVVLTVKMKEAIVEMDEVVITPENDRGKPLNELAVVSARSFSVEDAKNYAASVNDPSRAALSFAGVTSSDDELNEIIIRGNSPRGILWRVEGIEVPNPNHFSEDNSGGGGISILSVNVLDNSDFYTGAFPAEYGNASSGVFDLKLRNGNSFKREAAFQVGLLGVDVALEGPFSKDSRASYLVNYRYSTLGILDQLGLLTSFSDAIPNFQDLSYKVNLPTKKAGVFSIWGLGGLSEQKVDDELEPEVYSADLGVGGLSHSLLIGENTLLKTALVYSYQAQIYAYEDIPFNYFEEETFINQTFRGKIQLSHKFNPRFSLQTGIIGSALDFEARVTERDDNVKFEGVNTEGNTTQWQGYVQASYRLSKELTLNAGLHTLYLALTDAQSVEPRVGAKWQFHEKQSLSFGYGRHARIESMSLYFANDVNNYSGEQRPNTELGLAQADHLVLAYDLFPGRKWHAKAEVYYQRLTDIPIAAPEADDEFSQVFSSINLERGFEGIPLVNEGEGENYGLELTVEKFFTNDWYLLTTASFFSSQFTPQDGISRDTRFNSGFATTWLAGKEFQVGKDKRNGLGVNARVLWNGGGRFFNFDLPASRAAGFGIRNFAGGYSLEGGDYLRLDFRVNYRINTPTYAATLSLDLQNATNRGNVFNYFYNSSTGQLETNRQLGLVPVLNLRVEL
ncbi:MAG: TonB-dependent receptor [Bacteroidota bacterium]